MGWIETDSSESFSTVTALRDSRLLPDVVCDEATSWSPNPVSRKEEEGEGAAEDVG